MAIPKSNISLKQARADVDRAATGNLKDTYLRHRAKDHAKNQPISMKSGLAGTVISLQPYTGKYDGYWSNSPYLGKRYASYSDIGGTKSQIQDDRCSLYTNWTGRYTTEIRVQHKKTAGGDVLNNFRLFGEIDDPTAQFILTWRQDEIKNCDPQVELHGWADGPAAGDHTLFGYKGASSSGTYTLGPYTVGVYRYLLAVFPAIHRPRGTGTPIWAEVNYSNISVDLV